MHEESKTKSGQKKPQPELNQNHTCAIFISKRGYTF